MQLAVAKQHARHCILSSSEDRTALESASSKVAETQHRYGPELFLRFAEEKGFSTQLFEATATASLMTADISSLASTTMVEMGKVIATNNGEIGEFMFYAAIEPWDRSLRGLDAESSHIGITFGSEGADFFVVSGPNDQVVSDGQ